MEVLNQFLPLLLLIGVGYFIYKVTKKSKEKGKQLMVENYEKKRRMEEEMETLKNDNPSEFDRIKNELKEKEDRESLKDKLWKKSRIGLWILVLPHVIFEQVMKDLSDEGGNFQISVIINFYISRWYIKNQIFDKGKVVTNPILYGIGIGLIVFCIRLTLGFLFGIIFM